LDTHIVVRWLTDAKKLSREQARVLEAAVRQAEPLALSAVSLLEIAVLSSQGKLKLKMTVEGFFDHVRAGEVFQILPLTYEVAAEVDSLGGLRDRGSSHRRDGAYRGSTPGDVRSAHH
jgi:PIN domain nuclease of toxin-antitoxin system